MTEQSKEALIEQAKQFREEILTVMETLGNHMCDVIERADDLAKENAALRERLSKAVDKEQIAKYLAGMFGCP